MIGGKEIRAYRSEPEENTLRAVTAGDFQWWVAEISAVHARPGAGRIRSLAARQGCIPCRGGLQSSSLKRLMVDSRPTPEDWDRIELLCVI